MVIIEDDIDERKLIFAQNEEDEYEDVDDQDINQSSLTQRLRSLITSFSAPFFLQTFFARTYTFIASASWILTTSLILIGLPVLYAYDREQNLVSMEREQQKFKQWDDLDQQTFLLSSTLYILAIDLLLYPTDLLTTRLQADRFMDHGNVKVIGLIKDILHQDGIKGLFRGFWVNTIGSFPGQFIYYVGYEYTHAFYSPLFNSISPKLEIASHAMAGLTAEALSAFSYLPTDIVAQRLQTHNRYSFLPERFQTRSSWGICKHVWTTEGLKGFYRGYGPYVMVYGPGSAVWWAVYESGKSMWDYALTGESRTNREFDLLLATNYFVSGSLAGVVGCLVTNPLDVIRTRLQLFEFGASRERNAIHHGFLPLLRQVYTNEGLRGLYKGIKPRLWVRAPGSAVALLGYEYLKTVCAKAE